MGETDGYVFDDDATRVDLEALWQFLGSSAYWGRWRGREDVEKQVLSSWRVVGCYTDQGAMVGFARALSDGCALAYLADLYILPAHRGRGLGRRLVDVMIEQGPGQGFRWMLHTADAHELYRRFGFAEPDDTFMERPGEHSRPAAT